MINNIIGILHRMEGACNYECFPSITTGLSGNLVLEWRWEQDEKAMKFSIEVMDLDMPQGFDCISFHINQARMNMA